MGNAIPLSFATETQIWLCLVAGAKQKACCSEQDAPTLLAFDAGSEEE